VEFVQMNHEGHDCHEEHEQDYLVFVIVATFVRFVVETE